VPLDLCKTDVLINSSSAKCVPGGSKKGEGSFLSREKIRREEKGNARSTFIRRQSHGGVLRRGFPASSRRIGKGQTESSGKPEGGNLVGVRGAQLERSPSSPVVTN